MKSFSTKTLQFLRSKNPYYVYALVDPRNNEVFYIGKGLDNRVFQHEIEAGKNKNSEKEKIKRINDIEKEGLEVIHLILNYGLTEDSAFLCEATAINVLM